jgi:hypothetical protein
MAVGCKADRARLRLKDERKIGTFSLLSTGQGFQRVESSSKKPSKRLMDTGVELDNL